FEGVRNETDLRALLKPVYFYKASTAKLPERNVQFIPLSKELGKEHQSELQKAFEEKLAYGTIKKQNALFKTQFTIDYC
ncbi:hypothetical protein Q8W27_17260, partial [Oceanobacter sp. 2_MG-2023]|uniref:hypothetical protein n=1 Tax=Oceanobacter sp. 2_MG-2023 TaxID=3062619 RepID=UPI0027357D99